MEVQHPTWPAVQLLQSMPQLRTVIIVDARWFGNLDGLLEDAAGCTGLQKLRITLNWDYDDDDDGKEDERPPEPFWATARGLAALAAGPCSSTLQALQLQHCSCPCWMEAAKQIPALSPAEVALLLGGAFPQLQELSVEVRLSGVWWRPAMPGGDTVSSSAGSAAVVSEAQVSACLASIVGASPYSVHVMRGLVRRLLELGVQGLAQFQVSCALSGDAGWQRPWTEVEGRVGACRLRCIIWPS
jgi:hypothetical protein